MEHLLSLIEEGQSQLSMLLSGQLTELLGHDLDPYVICPRAKMRLHSLHHSIERTPRDHGVD